MIHLCEPTYYCSKLSALAIPYVDIYLRELVEDELLQQYMRKLELLTGTRVSNLVGTVVCTSVPRLCRDSYAVPYFNVISETIFTSKHVVTHAIKDSYYYVVDVKFPELKPIYSRRE